MGSRRARIADLFTDHHNRTHRCQLVLQLSKSVFQLLASLDELLPGICLHLALCMHGGGEASCDLTYVTTRMQLLPCTSDLVTIAVLAWLRTGT